jgi:uncharacterized Zn finger protein (UPF0148 family)
VSEQCCKTSWQGFHSTPCPRAGKVQRAGKWYCGVHDPDKQAARDAKRQVEWARKDRISDARSALHDARDAAADLVERGSVTLTELTAARDAICNARKQLDDCGEAP